VEVCRLKDLEAQPDYASKRRKQGNEGCISSLASLLAVERDKSSPSNNSKNFYGADAQICITA
jgi:hypothetical protein